MSKQPELFFKTGTHLIDNALRFQFNRYFIVGVVATLVDWGLFYFLAIFMGIHYLEALVLSFSAGSVTNYGLNRTFTFQSDTDRIVAQFTTFMVITIMSLGISSIIVYVNIKVLTIHKMLSRIITTFCMLGINFILHKNLTFNENWFK